MQGLLSMSNTLARPDCVEEVAAPQCTGTGEQRLSRHAEHLRSTLHVILVPVRYDEKSKRLSSIDAKPIEIAERDRLACLSIDQRIHAHPVPETKMDEDALTAPGTEHRYLKLIVARLFVVHDASGPKISFSRSPRC